MPGYLHAAYSLRYQNEANEGNCLVRAARVVQRVCRLIREILFKPQSMSNLRTNSDLLRKDFTDITATIKENQKPICIYFVSAYDSNGAILSDPLYYYHHYKIRNLQRSFAVAPALVSSQEEMKACMMSIKQQYPQRAIQFVDVVSHGSKSCLAIQKPFSWSNQAITVSDLREDLFEECAPDATILLDACLTGMGDRNIADEIARKTPGRTVLAPGTFMYFSKPIVQKKPEGPRVAAAVHGFALVNAYTCKSFHYDKKMATRFPYVDDQALHDDLLAIADVPEIQNSWLDGYFDESSKEVQDRVVLLFRNLSKETRELIIKEIGQRSGGRIDAAKGGEQFLLSNPLHPTVRAAFRSVFNELLHEVREVPAVGWAKSYLFIRNCIQSVRARILWAIHGRQVRTASPSLCA